MVCVSSITHDHKHNRGWLAGSVVSTHLILCQRWCNAQTLPSLAFHPHRRASARALRYDEAAKATQWTSPTSLRPLTRQKQRHVS